MIFILLTQFLSDGAFNNSRAQLEKQTQAPVSILKRGAHHRDGDHHLRKDPKKAGIKFTEDNRAFERADTFGGARPGFVFKRGSEGLGYYAEEPTTPDAPKGCCSVS